MTYKDLFYFTGQCLSLDEHPAFRETIIEQFTDARNIQNSSFKIQNFLQLCSDHLVIPVIYLKFKKHGILEFLPEDLVETLQTIYELNRERNEQILRQIDNITTLLNKENIQPVFLKGTANLLDGLYNDVGERMAHDIDFLVREEEYLRTAELLLKNGYQTEPNTQLDNRERMHYPILSKPGEVAPVEVHRMPVSKYYSAQFNAEMIFSRKKAIPGKPGLYVPSDPHKLIHAFIHGQLIDKGYAYKQSSFREIYDLYLLSKRTNVSQLASLNKYRNKTIAWLVFCQRVVHLPGRFYSPETKGAKLFCLKFNFSLKFVGTYNAYVRIKKILHLIGPGYLGGVFKALSDREERRYLLKRISNPQWYRAHWTHYKEYIS